MADKPYNKRPRRSQGPAPEQVVVEAVAGSLWRLLKFLFSKRGSGGSKRSAYFEEQVAKIREGWQDVDRDLLQENTQALAVSEADKLLDAALQAKNIAGETMGERLKMAVSYFPGQMYDDIWQAHKLRNHLAHEIGARVSQQEAVTAVNHIRGALRHLGIL